MRPVLLRLFSGIVVSSVISAFRRVKKREELKDGTNTSSRGDLGLPPCIAAYRWSDAAVMKKQQRNQLLSRREVTQLIKAAKGEPGKTCGAVSGTTLALARPKDGGTQCIEKGKKYTVCYRNRQSTYVGPKGEWHCGVYYGGVPGARANGDIDCLGGCNEGNKACGVNRHRFSCMVHDVCSIVQNAKGFTTDKQCGREAAWAVLFPLRCKSKVPF